MSNAQIMKKPQQILRTTSAEKKKWKGCVKWRRAGPLNSKNFRHPQKKLVTNSLNSQRKNWIDIERENRKKE